MRISSLEIQNFRRLKSTHIDFGDRSTIFVGANNSGKTSAMIALRYFLISPNKLSLHDITVTNWARIDVVGNEWEQDKDPTEKFESLLPALDVWLDVPLAQIHHVAHILPTIDWKGGLLGVRLQYKPSTLENLKAAYLRERAAALKIIEVKKGGKKSEAIRVWPASLTDFLKKRLTAYLEVEAYVLDPESASSRTGGLPGHSNSRTAIFR